MPASTRIVGLRSSLGATAAGRVAKRVFGPIRARATLLATLMLAGALGLGSEGLLELLRSNLERSRQEIAVARARDLASLAASGGLRSPLSVLDEGTAVAQLVDTGRIVARTPNASADVPLAPFEPVGDRPAVRSIDHLPSGPAGRYRVVALAATVDGRRMTVYVGVGLRTVDHAIGLLSVALALGLPVLVLIGGFAIWVGVDRALRPVERLRRDVAAVSARNLHERVSAPRSGDEIDRLAATMNSMLERLETAAATERRFIADASHELRSPLAAMRAQLETARSYPEKVDWTELADVLLADQSRVERLVGDLLLLARLDSGEVASTRLPVRLGEVIAGEVGRRPVTTGVHVTFGGVDRGDTLGDAAHLARMIRNLLDNAERHASSAVTVTLAERGDELIVHVADDGHGIAIADRARVFERFTRLDDARVADDGGSGLGLAIVRDIAAAHGGTVAVVDSATGACLEARLPAISS